MAPSGEARLIYPEQVSHLYRNAAVGMVATLANSLVVAYVERNVVSRRALAAWVACLVLITLLRYLDVRRYRRAAVTPGEARRWGARFIVGICLSGMAWGSAAVFLFPGDSLAHQIFLAFVLGGMVAGAAGTFSATMSAFFAFALPALAPITVRFLAAGESLSVAMGAMALLFGILIVGTALRVHEAIVNALRIRFQNEDLITILAEEKDRAEAMNEKLADEIAERKRAEKELERHRDHLREMVTERTADLTAAYDQLQKDMAERRRAEEALRDSEARFRSLVEQATDAFFLHDLSGRFIEVNEQACRSLGYSRDELLGLTVADVSVNYDSTGVREVLEKLANRESITLEDVQRRKDGSTFPVEVRVGTVEETGRVLSLSLARDITERKRAEEALRAAKETAEEATRAKSEFLANMSHEIRTPMNGVLGMIELALRTPSPAEQAEYLKAAQRSAQSLLRILDEILDFSRIEAGRLEIEEVEFDLRPIVEGAAEVFAPDAHSKGLELVCHLDPSVPRRLLGDPGRLRQVLVNLIGNAVKFTDEGEVVVRVAPESPPQGDADTRYLRFCVRDTGIGVPSDKIGLLFESFRQVDGSPTRRYGGTGLGLAISKRTVEMMGGSIDVYSQEGAGSTFSFVVPFRRASLAQADTEPFWTPGTEVRALVVDDNRSSRTALRDMLAGLGAKVGVTATGEAALRLLREAEEARTPFGFVLLDSRLKDADGFTVAEQMHRHPAAAPRVFMMAPAHDPAGDLTRCIELGLSACLTKPVKESDVVKALQLEPGPAAGRANREEGAPSAAKPSGPRGAREPGVTAQRARILLVEDDPTSRLMFSTLLQQAGWEVTTVTDGRAAVESFESGEFDLVLMDVQMPEMDGLDATRVIRAREAGSGAHIPVIGLTARALERDKQSCLAAGMDDHLPKPVEFDRLFAAVQRYLPSAAESANPRPRAPADPSRVVESLGGNKAQFASLVGTFLEAYPRKLWELGEGIREGDGARVASAAHGLRGSVSIFGAEVAANLAQQLEETGEEGRLTNAPALYEKLRMELARLADFLAQC